MKNDDEKPSTLFIYDDCFAPLMRVARTDWKPLLWNAALALKSSKSAGYFLNKPENEEDLTAAALQGGLVHLWKESCCMHKTKTKYILKALQRRAPSPEEALEDLRSFFNVRKYPLQYSGPWFFDERWQLFQVQGKNIEEPFQSIPSSQMDSHPLKMRNWDIRFIRRHLVRTHRAPLKNLEDTLGQRIYLVMALCINSCF